MFGSVPKFKMVNLKNISNESLNKDLVIFVSKCFFFIFLS